MFFLKYQFPEASCFPERRRIWRGQYERGFFLKKTSYHETERGDLKKLLMLYSIYYLLS